MEAQARSKSHAEAPQLTDEQHLALAMEYALALSDRMPDDNIPCAALRNGMGCYGNLARALLEFPLPEGSDGTLFMQYAIEAGCSIPPDTHTIPVTTLTSANQAAFGTLPAYGCAAAPAGPTLESVSQGSAGRSVVEPNVPATPATPPVQTPKPPKGGRGTGLKKKQQSRK